MKLKNQSENISVEKAYEEYKKYQQARNITEYSLQYYDRCMKYFKEFFDITKPCNEITESVYIEYITHLQDLKTINDRTINTNLKGLRTILYYFMKKGYTTKFDVFTIKADEACIETYSHDELNLLLKKPNLKTCNFVEYRTWVMENFIMGTAARITTTLNVKIKDLDFDNEEVLLRNVKNRKPQTNPLPTSLCKILKEYLQYRGGSEDDYLFCNQFGNQFSRRGAQDCIKDYNLQRGVTKTSAHMFRHTFAKLWIMNDGDIFSLQKILGHSTLDMVKKYVSLWGDDLHIKSEKFNPLNELANNEEKKAIKILKKKL